MKTLTVGSVLKPQGIRGELKVKPFTDSAETFRAFQSVLIGGETYKVLSVRTGDGMVYLALRGVPDRNAAELLRGKAVEIPREEAPELPAGSYYIADLLGAEIVTAEGETLGTLKDVTKAGTDIYTMESCGREILFPAAAGVVLSVDLAARRITVDKKRYYEVAVL